VKVRARGAVSSRLELKPRWIPIASNESSTGLQDQMVIFFFLSYFFFLNSSFNWNRIAGGGLCLMSTVQSDLGSSTEDAVMSASHHPYSSSAFWQRGSVKWRMNVARNPHATVQISVLPSRDVLSSHPCAPAGSQGAASSCSCVSSSTRAALSLWCSAVNCMHKTSPCCRRAHLLWPHQQSCTGGCEKPRVNLWPLIPGKFAASVS